jgi:hypothetical protein
MCSTDSPMWRLYVLSESRQFITLTYPSISLLATFEVLTAVVMKTYVLWDISPFIPLKVTRRFSGTRRPYPKLPLTFNVLHVIPQKIQLLLSHADR